MAQAGASEENLLFPVSGRNYVDQITNTHRLGRKAQKRDESRLGT
jgi:hypothetical protein